MNSLRRSISSTLGTWNWTGWEISRSADGQRVVRARLRPGDRTVIAKIYVDGTKAETACRALTIFRDVSIDGVRIPRLEAFSATAQVIVMEDLPGFSPIRWLGTPRFYAAMSRAGHALRAVHGSGIDVGEPKTFADQVRIRLEPQLDELVRLFPSATHIVDAFHDRVACSTPIADVDPCPLHGDFQIRQLLDNGPTVGIVDWDDYCAGDPAFDIAYFTTYLRTHLPQQIAGRAVTRFLHGYRANEGILARTPSYEAFNYLRRATRRIRLRDQGWHDQAALMVRRCAATLGLAEFDRGHSNPDPTSRLSRA